MEFLGWISEDQVSVITQSAVNVTIDEYNSNDGLLFCKVVLDQGILYITYHGGSGYEETLKHPLLADNTHGIQIRYTKFQEPSPYFDYLPTSVLLDPNRDLSDHDYSLKEGERFSLFNVEIDNVSVQNNTATFDVTYKNIKIEQPNNEPTATPTTTEIYIEPTGVDKILVETYGYEWVYGKAWPAGTAPEAETPAEPEAVTTATPQPEPAQSPIPEDNVEQAPGQPEAEPTLGPTPEPTPALEPRYPEPTGVDKILVETHGYEWVNGKAWPAGTAPEPESPVELEPETTPTSQPEPAPSQKPEFNADPVSEQPAPGVELIIAEIESAPTGVGKVLVENYGYSWIEGKYYSSGSAPEIELEGDAIHTVTVSKVGNQNVFFIDGNSNPYFVIAAGKTYRFDQSDASNANHPLNFLSEARSDISSFVEVTGTAGTEGAYLNLRFDADDIANIDGPELSYYCELHGTAMGNEIEIQNVIA